MLTHPQDTIEMPPRGHKQLNQAITPVLDSVVVALINGQDKLVADGLFLVPGYHITHSMAASTAVHIFHRDLRGGNIPSHKIVEYFESYDQEEYSNGASIYMHEETLASIARIAQTVASRANVDPYWGKNPNIKKILSVAIYYAKDQYT